jgi:DNA recombination protein RmuC
MANRANRPEMNEPVWFIGTAKISAGAALTTTAMLAVAVLIAIAALIVRASRERRGEATRQGSRVLELETRMGELARVQAETAGRIHTMGEVLSGRQAELGRLLAERLDAVTHRIGQSMETTTRHTVESLRHLYERLAVIDGAQKNLTELSSQVTSLREVLANKQSRGAFGQARMEAIVQDGLPAGSFKFQFTLSNRTRPDCVVFLPGDGRPIVIDAKFPLEAVSALRQVRTDEERKHVAQRLRQDVTRHINEIAERYLIPGETQDLALMFIPSESVYAELYEGFDDLIQRAYRAQVVLVSPSLLMLAIQVMQQILKDARMRDAAREIRTEVSRLTDDLARLRERVLKLQQHFGQASEDVTQILISADKIAKRGGRIEALEFTQDAGRHESEVVVPVPLGRKIEA